MVQTQNGCMVYSQSVFGMVFQTVWRRLSADDKQDYAKELISQKKYSHIALTVLLNLLVTFRHFLMKIQQMKNIILYYSQSFLKNPIDSTKLQDLRRKEISN